MPQTFLKSRSNWLALENPTRSAICFMLRFVFRRSWRAAQTRAWRRMDKRAAGVALEQAAQVLGRNTELVGGRANRQPGFLIPALDELHSVECLVIQPVRRSGSAGAAGDSIRPTRAIVPFRGLSAAAGLLGEPAAAGLPATTAGAVGDMPITITNGGGAPDSVEQAQL